jgi:hypothetical protein
MGVHDVANTSKAKKLLGIPVDEPVFIIRAQDQFSVPALARYRNLADEVEEQGGKRPKAAWFSDLDTTQSDFIRWQAENSDRVKVPD